MLVKTILHRIPNTDILKSVEYCRKRTQEAHDGIAIPEVGTRDQLGLMSTAQEQFVIVQVHTGFHNIAVWYRLTDL